MRISNRIRRKACRWFYQRCKGEFRGEGHALQLRGKRYKSGRQNV